jgi:hypothetical protein
MGVENVGKFLSGQQKELTRVKQNDVQNNAENNAKSKAKGKKYARATGMLALEQALAKMADVDTTLQLGMGNAMNAQSASIKDASTSQAALGKEAVALSNATGDSSEEIDQKAMSIKVRQQEITDVKTEATQKQGNDMYFISNLGSQQDVLHNMFESLNGLWQKELQNINRAKQG